MANFLANSHAGTWQADVILSEGFGAEGNETYSNGALVALRYALGAVPRTYDTAKFSVSGYIPIVTGGISNFNLTPSVRK